MALSFDQEIDPKKYRCIRCKAPSDVVYKLLPYCYPHEPAESKNERLPKEEGMTQKIETAEQMVEKKMAEMPSTPTETKEAIGGGWVVNAKDGTQLHDGFVSKKDASHWASLEVEAKRLKAGQYKIVKK